MTDEQIAVVVITVVAFGPLMLVVIYEAVRWVINMISEVI